METKAKKKHILLTLLIVVIVLLVLMGITAAVTANWHSDPEKIETVKTDNPYIFDVGETEISAHRSGGGIMPEETMKAFKNCIENCDFDVDVFEFDLHITKDDVTSFSEIADTNIEAVFRLILDAAVNNHVKQKEMPSTLYIISDMEFNVCVHDSDITNFRNAKRMFEEAGYKLPKVVFWNVASRAMQQPVTENEQGVALVSGCTPQLFSRIISGDTDPYSFMLEVINSERYAVIAA